MLHRLAFGLLLGAALVTPALADTDIVVDPFNYADDAAMQAQWVSTTGSTTSTFLFDASTAGQPYPTTGPGAVDGKAVIFDGTTGVGAGSVNKWATPFSAVPSATQNVVLSVDLGYDTVINNKKLSVGLRWTDPGGVIAAQNLIELGFWNQIADPPPRNFAHRAISFTSGSSGNNWALYGLDPAMDQLTEMDIDGGDQNGVGFHRFTATVSLTDVTFGLDLFADGINNLTGLPGLDAQDVVGAVATANGFNDLRFGIPSATGSSTNPLMGVDNVSLRLVDIAEPPGDNADFDEDGDVDGRDFLIWQRGFGTPDALRQDGNANPGQGPGQDGDVDGDDLIVWQNQYGQVAPPAALAAVPEPGTGLLLVAASAMVAIRRK
jgi:hypothetical protein